LSTHRRRHRTRRRRPRRPRRYCNRNSIAKDDCRRPRRRRLRRPRRTRRYCSRFVYLVALVALVSGTTFPQTKYIFRCCRRHQLVVVDVVVDIEKRKGKTQKTYFSTPGTCSSPIPSSHHRHHRRKHSVPCVVFETKPSTQDMQHAEKQR